MSKKKTYLTFLIKKHVCTDITHTDISAGYSIEILIIFFFLLYQDRFGIDGTGRLIPVPNDTPDSLVKTVTVVINHPVELLLKK